MIGPRESNIKCRLKRRVSNTIDLYDVHIPSMNWNPSNEENDTFSDPLTEVELADLGQRPMQNRISHCKSIIAYKIHPFLFSNKDK